MEEFRVVTLCPILSLIIIDEMTKFIDTTVISNFDYFVNHTTNRNVSTPGCSGLRIRFTAPRRSLSSRVREENQPVAVVRATLEHSQTDVLQDLIDWLSTAAIALH